VIGELESFGVTVTTDIDRETFREASAAVYEAFPAWTPGRAKTVRAILDQ
jgi:TRAP-type transport system periplasmic protein